MENQFSRTKLLLGKDSLEKLAKSRIAVFGLGGVGGSAAEALARSGAGMLDLIDNDKFSITNLNRQVFATYKTLGKYKAEAAKERILEINPNIEINVYKIFYSAETSSEFDFGKYDYIADAIDTVFSKTELIVKAAESGCPIISAMGMGNKLNPAMLEVSDIYKTSVCPLARVMRTELKKRGIRKLKVVYSKESPLKPLMSDKNTSGGKNIPGSTSFVPPAAGLIIASEIVKDLISTGSREFE